MTGSVTGFAALLVNAGVWIMLMAWAAVRPPATWRGFFALITPGLAVTAVATVTAIS